MKGILTYLHYVNTCSNARVNILFLLTNKSNKLKSLRWIIEIKYSTRCITSSYIRNSKKKNHLEELSIPDTSSLHK